MHSFPDSRVFARVDGDALFHNYRLLLARARAARPKTRLIAVIKANAYGHGTSCVLPPLLAAGCSAFAVATAREALEARRLAPAADLLVLGYTPPAQAPLLAEADVAQAVFSLPYANALSEAMAGRGYLKVHLKIDGGMCRLGFSPADLAGMIRALRAENLRPEGLFTHFPCADTDVAATRRALEEFLCCRNALKNAGFSLFSHAAASAALITLPEAVLDGVRTGIALYGLPTPSVTGLRPTLSLYAPLIRVFSAPAGTPVGYGGDFVTRRPSLIGTLPVGYGDGFPRAMQGATVTLRCKNKCFSIPLVGKVCMDLSMVDLTDTPAQVGDEVCLFDSAAKAAAHLGTIPYEVLTSLSPRVKRILTFQKQESV